MDWYNFDSVPLMYGHGVVTTVFENGVWVFKEILKLWLMMEFYC